MISALDGWRAIIINNTKTTINVIVNAAVMKISLNNVLWPLAIVAQNKAPETPKKLIK